MRRFLLSLLLACAAWAQTGAPLPLIGRIKTEAFDRSKVMDHLSYLTDVYGPRLTASPEYREAAEWAVRRLAGYGVSNVHLESWPFGRSWSLGEFSVEMTAPRYARLSAAPLAWSGATSGPVTGELIVAPLGRRTFSPKKAEEQFEAYKKEWSGKLRGKIVLLSGATELKPSTGAAFRRYTDAELAGEASAPEPSAVRDVKLDDIKFPDDEEELMRELRARSQVPVLMLTALGEEPDRIVGLEMGADDYLPKTFSTRELLARLRAVLRRSAVTASAAAESPRVIAVGALRIDVEAREAALAGRALALTPFEFELLLALARSAGRVRTREQLLVEVADRDFEAFDRAIDVHISSLRRKLGDDPRSPRFIETVRGAGYRMRGPDGMEGG